MKDLDFDELDRAVNSLMTNVPKTPVAHTSEEDEKTLDIESTISKDEPISFDKLDTVTAEVAGLATSANEQKSEAVEAIVNMPNTGSSPSTRRGGRFMDVVHPSSDMKKPTQPARPASRQGVTIDPIVSQRPVAPRVSTSNASEEPEVSKTTIATNEELIAGGTWPDPLAMTDFKNDSLSEEEWSAAPNTPKGIGSEPAPLTSPFLPDTKVEKRPLGASLSPSDEATELVSEPVEPREDKTVDDPNAQLPADPGDLPRQLPEELQSDLMSVEADTHMGIPKTEQSHPLEPKVTEVTPAEQMVEPATAPSVPTGPVSIPQQYQEEPSSGEQKSGSIYDTDTYHRPLDHPAKKKSGWMWIVWIILIILLGAGIGAGVFFAFLS